MRFRHVLVVGTVLALIFAGAGWAAQERIIRFAGASINPTDDLQTRDSESFALGDGTTLVTSELLDIEADSTFGFCLDFEQPINDRVGLGFTLMYAEPDLSIGGTELVEIIDDASGAVLLDSSASMSFTGSGDMMPLLVGPNFHFGTSDKIDFYAGPFLGYVFYDDVTVLGERAEIDDDFTYGAVAGLDVPFGTRNLGLSAAIRYMVTEAQPKDGGEALEIDPLTVQVGVSYRF